MGLDCYLYHYLDEISSVEELAIRMEEEQEALYEGIDYTKLTDQEKVNLRRKSDEIESRYNLDSKREEIELPSKKYPDHIFKIGYLRSSYNQNGFNSRMEEWVGMSLYDIFNAEDSYVVTPNWSAAHMVATHMLEELNKKSTGPMFKVNSYPARKNDQIQTSEQALAEFENMLKKYNKSENYTLDMFTTANGFYSMSEPVPIRALIWGKASYSNDACLYVIEECGEDVKWYREALEITIETIDYVLAQPDPERYAFHWSS